MKRRTSKGKMIDLEAIIANQARKPPAIGNMGVNSQGDVLGPGGTIVQENSKRVRAYYKDNPKSSTHKVSLKEPLEETTTRKTKAPVADDVPPEPDEFADPTEEIVEEIIEETAAEKKPAPKRKTRKKTPQPEEQTTEAPEEVADIEVVTEDGDIVMMTATEFAEYQANQESDSGE